MEKENAPAAAKPTYPDGHPLDEIQYMEVKLILKPEPFTSFDSFREFGRLVGRAASQVKKVKFAYDSKAARDTNVREIVFFV